MNDYLQHYGTAKMRWGLRRYQNEDGTWTEEGKRRRRITSEGGMKIKEGVNYGKNVSSLGSNVNQSIGGLKNLVNMDYGQNVNPNMYKDKLSKMSDNELRDYVNRMNMENQYTRMMSEIDNYKKNKGRQVVSQILDTAGNTALVAGSIASTIIAIQALRYGGL